MIIYHITSRNEWAAQRAQETYVPSGYAQDAFIHCSTAAQVWQVANRFFFGVKDMIVLEIDVDSLPAQPVFENLEGGSELFPHLYFPLPTSAVINAIELYLGPMLD